MKITIYGWSTSPIRLLRGRPKSVSAQASELHKREIGITPFDWPRDKSTKYAVGCLICRFTANVCCEVREYARRL
jgi:hypothetical protein